MTLRHVVTWKLSGESREARDAQASEIIAAIRPLAETVPTVRSLALHPNAPSDRHNRQVTLIADFDDADGLAVYATHPDHLVAVAVVKRHAAGRVATDFEL